MSLNLIYGAAKTGKTEYLLNLLSEFKNENCVVIVPEQISLSTENKIIEAFDFLSSNRDVLSFGRLFYKLYKEISFKKREYISSCGKAVIITEIIRSLKDDLSVFGNEKRISSYSEGILSTISEFKRYGLSPEDIKKCSEKAKNKSTQSKFSDLALIYEKYDEKILKIGHNSDDNSEHLIQLIPESSFVKNTIFFIDGFSSFTKVEREIIRLLCKHSKNVYVTLKTDKNNTYLFAEVEKTANLLKDAISDACEINESFLNGDKVHKNELLFLAENYGTFTKKKYADKTNDLFLYTSDTPYDEVNLCARDILKHLRNGYKYSDIAVATGNLEDYSSLIRKSFEEHGIKFYTDTKHNILFHNLTSFFIYLFDIHIKNFNYDDVFGFLKTGFTDFTDYDISVLENYVLKYGIKGKKWFDEFKYPFEYADLRKINELRKQFLDIVMPFRLKTKGKSKISVYSDALKEIIISNKISEKADKLSKYMMEEGRKDDALELRAVFNGIVSTIKEIMLATDNSAVGIEFFKDLFIAGVSEYKAGILPPTSDTVFCCNIENIRNREIKILYILNATDGVFPQKSAGTGIITENERHFMENEKIELAPSNKNKAMMQPFKVYETLTAPYEKLIISRPMSDSEGKNILPSTVINDIKELFPAVSENAFNSKQEYDYVATPKSTLMQILLNKNINFANSEAWYLNNNEWKETFLKIKESKDFVLSAKINQNVNKLMWNKTLNATVSRLESFARCPYSFLMKYGLKLNKREDNTVESSDTGTFIHKILEDSISEILNQNIDFSEITKEKSTEISEKVSQNAIDEIKIKHPDISPKEMFLIKRLKKASTDAIMAVAHHISAGDFIPYKTELSFENGNEIAPPIEFTTPNGNKVTLYGKVDRVDKTDTGFRIIDYKSSAKTLELGKVYDGITLQLFAYAASLKDKLGKPNGMYYFIFKPAVTEKEIITQDTEDTAFLKNYKMSGFTIGDIDTVMSMDKNMSGYSSVISARMTKEGLTAQKLMSYEQFDKLSDIVKEKIANYTDDILDGKFNIKPLITAESSACDYCDYHSICNFESQHFSCRKYFKIPDKEILDKLTEKEEN